MTIEATGQVASPEHPQDPTPTEAPKPDPLQTLQERLDRAEKELGETKLATRRTQGDATSNVRRLERQVAELRSTVIDLAARGMNPEEARAFKAEAALRDHQTQQDSQQAYQQAAADFEVEAQATLSNWGISPTDDRLQQAYARYSSENNSPQGWRIALNHAIADVRKDDEAKKDEERKRLEEELRIRQRNAEREAQGQVDRGQPTGVGGKRPSEMTDAELEQHVKKLDAEFFRTHPNRRFGA